MKILTHIVAAVAGAALTAAVFLLAPLVARGGVDADQTKAVQEIVEKYIQDHPEAIAKAMQQMQQREQAERAAAQRDAIRKHEQELLRQPDDLVLGNPKGDVAIVEFFDYRCPHCKVTLPTVMEAVKGDGRIRLVLKEFPILGPASQLVSRAAIASARQGKYAEFHLALLETPGDLDEDGLLKTARAAGLDTDRLQVDMKSPDIDVVLKRNSDLAGALGISGTPTFIVGGELVAGEVDAAGLRDLIARARAGD